MSDGATALGGAAGGEAIARIAEAPVRGMITLRGTLSDSSIAGAVEAAVGLSLPGACRTVATDALRLCWMSPDELMFLCPRTEVADRAAGLQKALDGHHALVANVSDARAMYELSGPHARDVLAKLCPVDLSPAAFGPGCFRRTRMAQVAAAFWMRDGDSFRILCFRSQARYLFDLLCIAAQPGSEVNHFSKAD